jgi:hypothetical protein
MARIAFSTVASTMGRQIFPGFLSLTNGLVNADSEVSGRPFPIDQDFASFFQVNQRNGLPPWLGEPDRFGVLQDGGNPLSVFLRLD